MGSTSVSGKVQIARSVAEGLACPLYQGDSLHESSAKAASIGTSRLAPTAATMETGKADTEREVSSGQDATVASVPGPNEARYRRMWLSKLTRTGLLFPEESRPATWGFSGLGGTPSTTVSRRGSGSSVA
jgi:hypothetical protein